MAEVTVVNDIGCRCFDGMDGFALVARRLCAGGRSSSDLGAGGGFAVGNER
ncbi:hypothetical protein [Microcoleus sp. FACHB-672]|uniref:hypothetical protein n=1 Tax=Microcoleus sp. FACHB-672 TaxID=2692825 RepID=UPI001685A1CB|nr:hypothetical protein [Microcoleus sp. FACHB-672]MBD2043026.1 hypothetical protein [Microcoleus sp. FACHB-672]